jgi:hypothetical protein
VRKQVEQGEGDDHVIVHRDGQNQYTYYLLGKHISVHIWESQVPGAWILTCDVARFDRESFKAKPHDAEDALRVALSIVGSRIKWLLQQQERELALIRQAIVTLLEKDVDQPPETK